MKYYADDGGEWTSSRFAERQKNMGNRRDKPSVRLVVSSGELVVGNRSNSSSSNMCIYYNIISNITTNAFNNECVSLLFFCTGF